MNPGPEGLLLVDKPSGPTSHDVVFRARRATGQRRIGHAGTLDPLASGLLPLVLGGATRLVRFLPHSPKIYVGSFRLGLCSDSDDVTGVVLERHEGTLPDAASVAAAAATLLGIQLQVPPAVSARKVGGQRLYKLARQGVRVEAEPSTVDVARFDVVPTEDAGCYELRAEVSGGTYIRALVRDLGRRLGCGAVLTGLRRIRIGPMDVADAVPASALEAAGREALGERVLAFEAMPLEPPAMTLSSEDDERRFGSGNPVIVARGPAETGHLRIVDRHGRLLGIAESRDGLARPRVVLRPWSPRD